MGVYYKTMTVDYTEIFSEGILSVPIFMIIVSMHRKLLMINQYRNSAICLSIYSLTMISLDPVDYAVVPLHKRSCK